MTAGGPAGLPVPPRPRRPRRPPRSPSRVPRPARWPGRRTRPHGGHPGLGMALGRMDRRFLRVPRPLPLLPLRARCCGSRLAARARAPTVLYRLSIADSNASWKVIYGESGDFFRDMRRAVLLSVPRCTVMCHGQQAPARTSPLHWPAAVTARVSRGQAVPRPMAGSRREGTQVKRPTIADIASRAGVTKAAVSFALNGQPGVSAATRERILAIASEIGFQPSSAARALSDGRAGAFGLVVDRPARTLGIESFFMQLISGIQAELSRDHIALLFTTAEDQAAEIDLSRTWWAHRRVDGVFLLDLQLRDQRVNMLEELRMPAIVFGTPKGSGSLPAVWQDDVAATRTVVEYLAGLGHPRLAPRSGRPG